MDADADLAAALQQELMPRSALRGAEGARRRARLSRSAAQGARPGQSDETVRRGFQKRFTHIFVDEFQDTDPLQAEILLLLASADPVADRLARRSPRPGPALHRRRPEAVDLPVPPRRRRDLSRRVRAARERAGRGSCS